MRTSVPRRQLRRAIGALGVGLILSLGASSCATIEWRAGASHGVLIETTAGRASLVIYRKYTRALWAAFDATNSIYTVRDVIWHYGAPPLIEACTQYGDDTYCIGTRQFRDVIYDYMFNGNIGDLREAMYDSHGADSCLAFTVISFAQPDRNWTHKQSGCRFGDSAGENPETVIDIEEPTGDLIRPGN